MAFTRAENEDLAFIESASILQSSEVLKHIGHRIGADGTRDPGVVEFLQNVAVNTSLLGIIPQQPAIATHADTTAHEVVRNPGNAFIVVFDILLSINGVANISFEDADGNDVLGRMYAPNAGQGYSFSSVRGLWLPRDASLWIQSSAAVNYSAYFSYQIYKDE